MLETIQDWRALRQRHPEWRAGSSIATESLQAQGREEDGMAELTLYERLGGIFAIAASIHGQRGATPIST